MTENEIVRLWEWCGFTPTGLPGTIFYWDSPDGEYYGSKLPNLTLDNLFKWAMPLLVPKGYRYELVQWRAGQHKAIILKLIKGWGAPFVEAIADTAVEALAQAILRVIEKVKHD